MACRIGKIRTLHSMKNLRLSLTSLRLSFKTTRHYQLMATLYTVRKWAGSCLRVGKPPSGWAGDHCWSVPSGLIRFPPLPYWTQTLLRVRKLHSFHQDLLRGLKAAARKSTSLSKMSEVIQEPQESPIGTHWVFIRHRISRKPQSNQCCFCHALCSRY